MHGQRHSFRPTIARQRLVRSSSTRWTGSRMQAPISASPRARSAPFSATRCCSTSHVSFHANSLLVVKLELLLLNLFCCRSGEFPVALPVRCARSAREPSSPRLRSTTRIRRRQSTNSRAACSLSLMQSSSSHATTTWSSSSARRAMMRLTSSIVQRAPRHQGAQQGEPPQRVEFSLLFRTQRLLTRGTSSSRSSP